MDTPFYLQKPVDDKYRFTPESVWNAGYEDDKDDRTYLAANDLNKRLALADNFKTNMEHIANAQPAASKQRPNSWMDSINYENGYDESVENRLRNEHKYLELADYLSHFKMNNVIDQRAYENEIAQLKRYGRQYNAIHSRASREQSNAISFLEAYNSGDISSITSDNDFKTQYDNIISFLGKNVTTTGFLGETLNQPEIDDAEASNITVTFNNKHVSYGLWGFGFDWMSADKDENQFNKFAKDTGYDLNTLKNILGETYVTSDNEGRVVVSIPKSNLAGIKVLANIRQWAEDNDRTTDDVAYASYDTNNNIISDNTVNIGHQIQQVANLLDDANSKKDAVVNSIGAGNEIVSTTSLPYMNERQMQLKQLVDNGIIDDTKYSSMLKADNEIYENLLLATDFTQLEVYTNDKNDKVGDRTLRKLEDNFERGALKDYINNAIKENRVSWRAAISGGEYGTYIEIAAVDDDGKLVIDKDDSRRGMTLFIPGLFTESIQQAFNASTQGKTVAEINSMQQYGYEYTLQNGDILSSVGNEGARLYEKDKKSYKFVNREEAQNILHRDIIVEDATMNIRNRLLTNDNNPRVGYKPEQDAKKIAIAAANELYPGRPIEEYDIAAWNPSKKDSDTRRAKSDIYADYKSSEAFSIYTQIMNNIYKLLNSKIR